MKRSLPLKHEFVECFPDVLEEMTLYVCMGFSSVSHKCCCGCGKEVVTPLSPMDWKLTFDGRTITLYPSIGNWGFPCRSHYWIRHNSVEWAPSWSDAEIKTGRLHDRYSKEYYFAMGDSASPDYDTISPVQEGSGKAESSTWKRIKQWYGRRLHTSR